MKKYFVMIPLLILLFGCGQKITRKSLIGKWGTSPNTYFEFREDGSFTESDDFGLPDMQPIVTSGTYEIEDKKGEPWLILKGRGPWDQYKITKFNRKTMVLESYSGNVKTLNRQ